MNLVELSGYFFSIAGAVLASIAGLHLFGPVGAVVGGICGLYVGYGVGPLIVAIPIGVGIFIEKWHRRWTLQRCFGKYWNASAIWAEARRKWPLGHEVRGTVVKQFYYGFVLDIGCGYPSLVARYDSNGYSSAAPPPMGSEVTAHVNEANDREHEFELTQRDPDQEAERLSRIGLKAMPSILTMLTFWDWYCVTAAVRALAIIGPEAAEALPSLKQLLAHESPHIRSSAEAAISSIEGGNQANQ